MLRAVLLFTLLLAACGDDSIATTDSGSGSSGSSSTTTTGPTPTTSEGATETTTTTTGSDSDASSSSADSTTTSTTSTTDTGTQGVESSSTSGDDSTTGSSTSTTTDETTTTTTTGETTTTTTGETTTTTTGETTDTTGEVVGPPVPAGLCTSGELTSFVEPMAQAEELHVIGVYQATGGAITVDITRADVPLTLVLSSYEPVAFTLNLAPGVLLEHVILNGYNAHSVQGQGAAAITDVSGQFNFFAACGYFWPENDGGCDTPGLVAGAEAATGLSLTSFAGCYEGSGFSLD